MNIDMLKSEIDTYAQMENLTKPLISIIVPAYNVEDYIGICLLSLIKQTLRDIEIIVINDGSTDKTGEIINLFTKDKRIKVITQTNQGPSMARNAGLDTAQGDYIGFVDSDDWIDENYYETLYAAVTKYDADIGITSILKHKKNRNKYNVIHKREKYVTRLKDKIKICEDKKHSIFYVWNRLYKRNVIEKNKLRFPAGRIWEDVTFSIRAIFYANGIVSVPKVKYHYIEREHSIVKSKDIKEKKIRDKEWVYTDMIDFARRNNIILPDRLNYVKSYWEMPFFKVYTGKYKNKITLFGLIPLLIYTKNEGENDD